MVSRSQKSEDRSQKTEGWKVGYTSKHLNIHTSTHPNIQTSKHLNVFKKGSNEKTNYINATNSTNAINDINAPTFLLSHLSACTVNKKSLTKFTLTSINV